MIIEGPFYVTIGGKRVQVEVYVDAAALAHQMAPRAYANNSGRTKLAYGCVIVTANDAVKEVTPTPTTGAEAILRELGE